MAQLVPSGAPQGALATIPHTKWFILAIWFLDLTGDIYFGGVLLLSMGCEEWNSLACSGASPL